MKYSDITEKIIRAAFKVQSVLGNSFQKVIYQRALEMELQKQALPVAREFKMPIWHEGLETGTRRVDFLIDQKISVEVKASITLEDMHLAQALNYLEAYHLETGLLFNFGAKRLTNRKHPDHVPS
jgi:GxxExxY protein